MLTRTGPALEPFQKEICSPGTEDGRVVTRSVQMTVEREVLSVTRHRPGAGFLGRCPECGCEVTLLPVEAAAQQAKTNPRAIYRWVEAAEVHFQEDATFTVFVCSESLSRALRKMEAGAKALGSC